MTVNVSQSRTLSKNTFVAHLKRLYKRWERISSSYKTHIVLFTTERLNSSLETSTVALRLKFNTEIELKCYYLSGGRKVLEIQFPQRRPLHAKDKAVRGSSSAVYIARNTPRSNRGCHMHDRAWI